MPNWCYNTMELRLLNKDIRDAFKLSLENEVLFSFLCPLDLGYDEDGKPKWDHDIAVNKWGTKWDVSSLHYTYDHVEETFYLNFDTAWGPPQTFYISLMDNDDVDFIRATYIEGGMEFLGSYTNDCGTIINDQYDFDDVIPEELGLEVGLDDYSDEPVFSRDDNGNFVRKDPTKYEGENS